MRIRIIGVALAATLLVAGLLLQPPRAIEMGGLWIESVEAPGDSVKYIARWNPPVLGRTHRPLDGYDVDWMYQGTPQARNNVTAPTDSVQVERPMPGDSLGPISVRVRSRDISGAVSDWLTSSPWWLKTDAVAPPPPTGIEVDSLTLGVLGVVVRPNVVTATVGSDIQLCAFAQLEDGSWTVSPELPICHTRLQEYLTQVLS